MASAKDTACGMAEAGPRAGAFDALLRAAVALRRHVETVAREHDLTAPQARLLITLAEPMRMQQAAEATACEPSHLTALADQLVQAGMVTREPDPDDRRARQLRLTAKGTTLRARLVPALLEQAPVIGDLDDAACARLRDLIAVEDHAC